MAQGCVHRGAAGAARWARRASGATGDGRSQRSAAGIDLGEILHRGARALRAPDRDPVLDRGRKLVHVRLGRLRHCPQHHAAVARFDPVRRSNPDRQLRRGPHRAAPRRIGRARRRAAAHAVGGLDSRPVNSPARLRGLPHGGHESHRLQHQPREGARQAAESRRPRHRRGGDQPQSLPPYQRASRLFGGRCRTGQGRIEARGRPDRRVSRRPAGGRSVCRLLPARTQRRSPVLGDVLAGRALGPRIGGNPAHRHQRDHWARRRLRGGAGR